MESEGITSSSGWNRAADPGQVHDAVEHVVGLPGELSVLPVLGAEALHRPDPGHRLFDDGRHRGELLLQGHGHGVQLRRRTAWPRC